MASTPITTTTATTAPGQLLMVAQGIQALELAIDPATRPNNVTITPDLENGTATITATIPISPTVSANGITFTAVDYL